jgi:hypothetical protein
VSILVEKNVADIRSFFLLQAKNAMNHSKNTVPFYVSNTTYRVLIKRRLSSECLSTISISKQGSNAPPLSENGKHSIRYIKVSE